jgi:hypothetical protein
MVRLAGKIIDAIVRRSHHDIQLLVAGNVVLIIETTASKRSKDVLGDKSSLKAFSKM